MLKKIHFSVPVVLHASAIKWKYENKKKLPGSGKIFFWLVWLQSSLVLLISQSSKKISSTNYWHMNIIYAYCLWINKREVLLESKQWCVFFKLAVLEPLRLSINTYDARLVIFLTRAIRKKRQISFFFDFVRFVDERFVKVIKIY